jgi:hypothetical protein
MKRRRVHIFILCSDEPPFPCTSATHRAPEVYDFGLRALKHFLAKRKSRNIGTLKGESTHHRS